MVMVRYRQDTGEIQAGDSKNTRQGGGLIYTDADVHYEVQPAALSSGAPPPAGPRP